MIPDESVRFVKLRSTTDTQCHEKARLLLGTK